MTAEDSKKLGDRLAVIDVGSSALKFGLYDFSRMPPRLIHEADPVATSLGRGLVPGGPLNREARRKSLEAVREFKRRIAELDGDLRLVVGTAAMRKTGEAEAFLADLRAIVGPSPEIRVISADEEARWALRSAEVMLALDERPRLFVDPGGSSNDFLHLDAGHVRTATLSFGMNDLLEIAAVTEEDARVDAAGIAALEAYMSGRYRELIPFLEAGRRSVELIGTSGAAIALGACHLDVRASDRQSRLLAAHDHCLPLSAIEELVEQLAPLSAAARRERHPCLGQTRSQIFVHSALIYTTLLRSLGLDELRINGYGMKLGGLLQQVDPK